MGGGYEQVEWPPLGMLRTEATAAAGAGAGAGLWRAAVGCGGLWWACTAPGMPNPCSHAALQRGRARLARGMSLEEAEEAEGGRGGREGADGVKAR